MRVKKRNMKYDITKPMPFKVGLYQLNKNPDFNFQLNRLVNMDGADGALPYTDFIRTETLCQGGEVCDFRFVRHNTDAGDGWERSKSI